MIAGPLFPIGRFPRPRGKKGATGERIAGAGPARRRRQHLHSGARIHGHARRAARGMRARARARGGRAQSRFSAGREGRGGFASCRFAGTLHVVGIRALDWRRPASREGRDASQERTLILNRGRSCSERQFNERVFRGRITVVHPSGVCNRASRHRSAADLIDRWARYVVTRATIPCASSLGDRRRAGAP